MATVVEPADLQGIVQQGLFHVGLLLEGQNVDIGVQIEAHGEPLPLPAQLFQPVLVGTFGILGQLLLQVDPVGQALVGNLQLQPVQAHEDIQGDFADAREHRQIS